MQRVITLTFWGMSLSLAVDVLIVARLGTDRGTDALVIALSVPFFIDMVVRAASTFSLVPVFIERREQLSSQDFERFASGLLNSALLVGLALTFAVELGAPLITTVMGPGLSSESKQKSALLLRLCAPMIIFALGSTVLGVLMNVWRKFSLAALRNAVAPGVVLVTLCLVWNRGDLTIWVALAYVIGFTAFFCVLLIGARQAGYRQQWSAWLSLDDFHRLRAAVSAPSIGFMIRQSSRFVDRCLASLAGAGAVSSYYFAFRIFSAVQTLIGYSIATTSLPTLTEQDLAGSKKELADAIRKNLLRTLLLAMPIVIGCLFFADEMVRLLYHRGALQEHAVIQIAQVLFWLGMGLLFACFIPVLSSGLFAQRAFGMLLRNQTTTALINILLAVLLSGKWGLNGIAMANSLACLFAVGNLCYLLHLSRVSVLGVRNR